MERRVKWTSGSAHFQRHRQHQVGGGAARRAASVRSAEEAARSSEESELGAACGVCVVRPVLGRPHPIESNR